MSDEEIEKEPSESHALREPESSVEQAAEDSGEERRRSYRLNKVLGATMTSTDGDTKSTRLFVIDISISGFRATDHQPPGEDECEISIVLAKGEPPFESRMRVVWVKELTVSGMFQMGCEFVDPDEEEVDKLTQFIESERCKTEQATSPSVSIGRPWTMIN